MSSKQQLVRLNDGHYIPALGFGTYKPNEVPRCKSVEAAKLAIGVGYRHIDTAYVYQIEEEIGQAIQSNIKAGDVKREDLFITTKALEKCKDAGLVKSIGVSNFNHRQLERILNKPGLKYKPVCNQVECHIYNNQSKLLDYCKSKDIVLVAYGALGTQRYKEWVDQNSPVLLNDPVLCDVAKKNKRSPALIALRYLVQRGVVPLAQSFKENEMKENLQVPENKPLEAINLAIEAGYRHIDTAYVYQTEKDVGQAIRSKIAAGLLKREDIFVTTKVMEKCKDAGLVKSIGVSNFNSRQLEKILNKPGLKYKPVCNQVECHLYLNQSKLLNYCMSKDIVLVAYCALGSQRPKRWVDPSSPVLLNDPVLCEVAKKHKQSPAQVALRYHLQRGIVVLAQSYKENEIKENLQVPKSKSVEAANLAIGIGYRHIDTAYAYQIEEEIGQAIQSKINAGVIKREDMFITTKALEKCKDAGLVKSIGVSNFNHRQLERILNKPGLKYKPVCNQVECHLYLNQSKLLEYCKSKDIVLVAYGALGTQRYKEWVDQNSPVLLNDPVLCDVAKKNKRSPALIALRYLVQRGVIPLAQSFKENEMKENLQVMSCEDSIFRIHASFKPLN
ncbi:aldo-keto reductase family 1 member C12 [Cricetulus griseus]